VGGNAVMLLFATVGFGMPFILTLYAQQVLGDSPLEFGVGFVLTPVLAAVGMIVAQAASSRSALERSPRPAWRSWAPGR
jgi:hypothetical protein